MNLCPCGHPVDLDIDGAVGDAASTFLGDTPTGEARIDCLPRYCHRVCFDNSGPAAANSTGRCDEQQSNEQAEPHSLSLVNTAVAALQAYMQPNTTGRFKASEVRSDSSSWFICRPSTLESSAMIAPSSFGLAVPLTVDPVAPAAPELALPLRRRVVELLSLVRRHHPYAPSPAITLIGLDIGLRTERMPTSSRTMCICWRAQTRCCSTPPCAPSSQRARCRPLNLTTNRSA